MSRLPVRSLLSALLLVAAAPFTVTDTGTGAADGALRLHPAVAQLATPLQLTNGAAHEVTVDLALRGVAAGPDGEPLLAPWLDEPLLAVDHLTLAAGETASLTPLLDPSRAPGVPDVVAITAQVAGSDLAVAYRVITPAATDLAVAVAIDSNAGLVTLSSEGSGAAIVHGTIRIRRWFGVSSRDLDLPPTLVLAGAGRSLALAPDVIGTGPVGIQIAVRVEGGPQASASTSAWVAGRGMLRPAGVLLLLLTATIVVRVSRRARSAS